MKKTFPLHVPGLAAARVVDAIKHDVRKYVKRERGKKLPEGFDQWDFACQVGPAAATATPTALNDVAPAIDAIVATGATEVFIEVLAVAAHRAPRLSPFAAAAPLTPAAVAAPVEPAPVEPAPVEPTPAPPQSS